MDEEQQSPSTDSDGNQLLKTLMMCPICKKGFPTPSKVKRHLLAVHEKIREFQCDICSHAFSQKIHVLKHRQAVHKKELEANPDLLDKRDFKIPDIAVEPQKHVEVFNAPFQTMTVDKLNKSKKNKATPTKNNHVISNQTNQQQPAIVQITTSQADTSGLLVDQKPATSIIPSPPIG